MKKPFLILLSIFSMCFFSACGDSNFQSNTNTANINLESATPAHKMPMGKNLDYKIGDQVSVIKDDGVFEVTGQIEEVSGKLIFAPAFDRGRPGPEEWMPFENARNLQGAEKSVPKGYKVQIGEGRFTVYKWFPPSQIFPAPWANNVNLKIGDSVYEKTFGNFEPKKGTITELPAIESGDFEVRFDESERMASVKKNEIFSSIEPAVAGNLSPGDIVYYDNSYWAIVIGKSDDKVTIREAGFGAEDKDVNVSKLQILK